MSLDCLCAGIVVADQVCEPIARMPPPGGLTLTPRMEFVVGGCAANVAADFARLGLRVGLSGCVGNDLFGRAVAEMLRNSGVDVAGLQAIETAPTSVTFVINVQGEDRRFIHCNGANACYDGTSITAADLAATKVLYVGGYCLLAALTPENVARLLRRAREAGVTTVLDVVLPEAGHAQDWLQPVLPWTDYFFPNNDEARRLTGCDDPWEQARQFRAWGCRATAITRGGDGLIYLDERHAFTAGVYPVQAIDATGTGDAFVAGFVSGLLKGDDAAACLRRGAALGASCVRALGATAGVFTTPELEAFIAREPFPITTATPLPTI